jgi:hypothetical protein
MCERRSVSICCHESPHVEAADPPLRPFHTVSPRTPVNKDLEGKMERLVSVESTQCAVLILSWLLSFPVSGT